MPVPNGSNLTLESLLDSPYNLTRDIIRRDLSDDPPSWILSCYGPGKDAPEQLFGGYPREQSFEEMRLHYLQGAMSGNPQGAVSAESIP